MHHRLKVYSGDNENNAAGIGMFNSTSLSVVERVSMLTYSLHNRGCFHSKDGIHVNKINCLLSVSGWFTSVNEA